MSYIPVLENKKLESSGLLISFEGVDGSGKTTAISLLRDYIQSKGYPVKVFKLPSQHVRDLPYFRVFADDYKAGEDGRVDPCALFIILLGDRLLTVRKEIIELLNQGYCVICDRYIYMTFAQIGYYGCSQDDMDALIRVAELFPLPNAPFIIDIDAKTAIERVHMRPNESDAKIDINIYRSFIENLKLMAKKNNLHIVESKDLEEMKKSICDIIDELLIMKGDKV